MILDNISLGSIRSASSRCKQYTNTANKYSSKPNYSANLKESISFASFRQVNFTLTNSKNATGLSFSETNIARISHRLELIEKKIDNLPHQNQVGNAISVSRDDMIVFGARFRQLLANEFGANEIYDHILLEIFQLDIDYLRKL